jgi:hypothetical protein
MPSAERLLRGLSAQLAATQANNIQQLLLNGALVPFNEPYQPVTLLNGFVNFGSGRTGFRKLGGLLQLQIQVYNGSSTDNASVFILPVGFRPLGDVIIPVANTATVNTYTKTFPRITVKTTGDIQIQGIAGGNGVFMSALIPLDL